MPLSPHYDKLSVALTLNASRNMLRQRDTNMPPKPKSAGPKTARERMRTRRQRLRAQGLRPVQHWVPDLRNPRVRAAIRREAALLSQHPETAEIDAWLDAMHDPRDWS
jgi:antidote-toxin recognition MazE-like antitoxin